MAMATQSLVEIPALVSGGRTVIPAFRISADIGNWGSSALGVYKEAPTLAQLRYADSASGAIRENIHFHRYKGEFTADFVDYNAQKPRATRLPRGFLYVNLYQRPENVIKQDDGWTADGNPVGMVLPPDGWQVPDRGLLYNPETGFPLLTVNDRDRAIKELSRIMPREEAEKEVSYFWRWGENQKILSPVSRYYGWAGERGPSYVDAGWGGPSPSPPYVGSRVVRENVYRLDEGSYRELAEGLRTIREGDIVQSEVSDLAKKLLNILNEASR